MRGTRKKCVPNFSQNVKLVFIHSFIPLSYVRRIASPKASSSHVVICCFIFKFPVSRRFLKIK